MRYKTVERLSIGGMVIVVAINVTVLTAIGFVAWHFISKFW